MPLPIIPSTNPTTIPATQKIRTGDSFGYLLHFYIEPSFDGPWGLSLKSWNWDAASGTFAPPDTDKTPEADKAQHQASFLDVRPLIYPTLADGTTPNPQFLPAMAQIFGAVLEMFPAAILFQKATADLAKANFLPDSDKTKSDQIAAAQAALDAIRKQLGAT